MQHFSYLSAERKKSIFFKEPSSFTKYSGREKLAYTLGASLYMPALKENIAQDVIRQKYPELTSMVIDLEDAVGDNQLDYAETHLFEQVRMLYCAIEEQRLKIEEVPLIFIRVRNPEQLRRITNKLGGFQKVLTGYVFPKFSCSRGEEFLRILRENNHEGMLLYGMPILESEEIIYKENRLKNLQNIKGLLDSYKDLIVNVRIGATDFCGLFGIRRRIDTSIYDVSVVRDCITDILNFFNRKEEGYVVSGPVWEFFSTQRKMDDLQPSFQRKGVQRSRELDGLINEVMLDKLNGMVGKTIIHPTHIKAVHSLYTVTHEEYLDALHIMDSSNGSAGAAKSLYANKMNEMKPHYYWAKKILARADSFGVFHSYMDFNSLLGEEYPEAKTPQQEVIL